MLSKFRCNVCHFVISKDKIEHGHFNNRAYNIPKTIFVTFVYRVKVCISRKNYLVKHALIFRTHLVVPKARRLSTGMKKTVKRWLDLLTRLP